MALTRRLATAIEVAEATAADDAHFLALLRRTVDRTAADPSQHLYDDPRFLANARLLAHRAVEDLRVVGGVAVRPKQFMDCVAVGSDTGWGCTGTLVAPRVVVTAGHCISYATRVFFGNNVAQKGTIISVKERHRHPEYHKNGKRNDIMVLVLAKKAAVKPRRIATAAAINGATDGRVVGFGNTEATGRFGYGVKRQVDVPIASPSCSGKAKREDDSAAYGCDRLMELVAGKPLLAKDSCTGDSGGPLYVEEEGGWLLAGATSRATDSAMSACGDGGIYARVDKYVEFIEDIAGVKLGV